MQFIDFETVIYLAWRVGLGSFFLTILLGAIILFVRRYFDKKTRRAILFREVWEPILLQSLDEIPEELPVIEEEDMMTFLILWNYFQELLLEESKTNLLRLARLIDLSLISRKILRERNIKSRLLAVNTLGWMKDKESWNALNKLVNHRETTFSLAVARALVRINPHRSIHLVLPIMSRRSDWSLDKCADLIKQIGMDEISDDLVAQIYQTPRQQLPKMIRLLDLLLPSQSNPVIKRMLTKYDDKEIIFSCLTVYKDVDNLQRVRNFLTHKEWEIRMQAAICLGKFGSEEDIEYLISTTEDPEWWVRYRSAQALARIPEVTIERLQNIARFHSDQFSHDVILRIATEREVAELCGLSY